MAGTPDEWAAEVVKCFDRWKGDLIVAEGNYGGGMCLSTLQHVNPNLPVKLVTASRGKHIRAEPVSLLFEQGRVSFLQPMPELEQQLTQFSASEGYLGKGSPDRADAGIWSLIALSGSKGAPSVGGVSVGSASKWRALGGGT